MTVANLRSPEQGSLSDAVYDAVHHRIVTGIYRPNQRLVETEIAAELGASRTPVREALVRLIKDGLATKSRQGLTVREFTFEEVREIYEVRAALEGYAARLAADRRTPDALARIEETLHRHVATSTGETVNRAKVVEANAAFHETVLVAADNRRMSAVAAANLSYFFNNEVAAITSDEALRVALAEHEQIFAAIRDRDGELAERIVRNHVMAGLKVIESFL